MLKHWLAKAGIAAAGAALALPLFAGGASADTAPAPAGLTGYSISMGKQTAIPANSAGVSVAADAFCGKGKVVISGGVVTHSILTFTRTSYPADSITWQVVVTPTVNVGYDQWFQTYAVCADASSVPGYHQVQTAQLPVGVATYYGANKAVGDAYCGNGEVVVGGGVRSHNPSTFTTISRPTSDQRAWEVEVHLTNPPSYGGEYYQVSAVCIPAADVAAYSIKTDVGTEYGTNLSTSNVVDAAGTPYCGAGTLAVGAGASNHDQENGFLSSTVPSSDGKYWVVSDVDTNVPSWGPEHFFPVAICVTASV